MVKNIGIIGYGRFGKIAATFLKDHFNIFIYEPKIKRKDKKSIEFPLVSLKECAEKDIVLICVPISKFEEVLQQIHLFLREGTLVIDVCSVKEKPVSSMKQWVPEHCECLGTHPLFGPDSIETNLKGKKIVICPIRVKNLEQIKQFLESLGLSVMVSSPEEHDKQMARSLALIHLLGKALQDIELHKITMTTPTHKRLIDLIDIVNNDSKQLFFDMQLYNRFASYYRKKLIGSLIKLDSELDDGI